MARHLCRLLGLAALAAPPAWAAPDMLGRSHAFLQAYVRGDLPMVLAMVAPDVVVFGSDAAEVYHGRAGVARMLRGDQGLWRGPAQFGRPDQVAQSCGDDLCVVTIQAPFTLAGRPPVQVRVTLAWRKTAKGWRVVQSANASPTVGQSAAELLKSTPAAGPSR